MVRKQAIFERRRAFLSGFKGFRMASETTAKKKTGNAVGRCRWDEANGPYETNGRLLYSFACGVEGTEGRLNEELTIAEEFADAGIVSLNFVKGCEVPFGAVVDDI